MKKFIIIICTVVSCSCITAQIGHPNGSEFPQKKEITEQDYQEAISIFDADVDQPSKDLEKAMATAQMYLMRQNDNERMIQLFDKAADYAKRTDQITEYIDLRSNKAQLLISTGKYKEGVMTIDSLIAQYEIKPNMLARFFKAKGDAYLDLDDFENSEKSYFRGLSIAQGEKDTFNIGICYISLASMHSQMGNIYDAIDYNIKGLNILEQGDHAYLVTGACNVLTTIFQDLGNYEKAQEYAEKMDFLSTTNGYKQIGAFAKAALGRLAALRGDYEESLKHYDLAMKEFNRKGVRIHGSNDKRAAFRVKNDIAKIHIKTNNLNKAEDILNMLEQENYIDYPVLTKLNYFETQIEHAIAREKNDKIFTYSNKANELLLDDATFEEKQTYAWISKTIAEYYGKFREANEHLTTYFAMKDSIEKEQKSQLIHNLEAKYQKAEQEKEISKLSFENEKAEAQLTQKNILLLLGSIGVVILSFLVFQFYKLYQSNKRNKEQLASQNTIITKALDDKNTLLKEIHHRVKNNLQVISSLLSLQSRFIKDEETLDAIKAGKSRVQSMSLLHQNLYRDDNLKGVEMNQYFQNLVQNLFDTYNIEDNIQFTTAIDDLTLDIDTVVPMGLITNELISNALKHAFKGRDSGNIHLSLIEKENSLYLTVKDDGIGLPDSELPVTYKSLGATLIQSFTEKLEGEIEIDNSNGSSITIEINDYTKIK
ncbi:MAG: histidine kinase dimerization/phosphoacceptor domain -containing protein [Saprospiraceae bacterium]|nr:histidine kinase dimerization/phosphoacceptor domain -containing protein [Saprospiraceae bacterium]